MYKLELEGCNITVCIVQKSTSTPGKLRKLSIVKFNYFLVFQTFLHGLERAVGACRLQYFTVFIICYVIWLDLLDHLQFGKL